ncbi:MAG: hypothetical protein ABL997_14905, partial [Planctomycetota bacterium]
SLRRKKPTPSPMSTDKMPATTSNSSKVMPEVLWTAVRLFGAGISGQERAVDEAERKGRTN